MKPKVYRRVKKVKYDWDDNRIFGYVGLVCISIAMIFATIKVLYLEGLVPRVVEALIIIGCFSIVILFPVTTYLERKVDTYWVEEKK